MALNQLPQAFVERLKYIVPPHRWTDTVAGFRRPPPTCFRVNSLKSGVDSVLGELQRQGIEPQPVSWNTHSFVVPDYQRTALTHSPAFTEGRIYIHNLSSIFATQILAPTPGEEVLDLAAAPGGKTLALACAMENRGRIAAVEVVKSRFFRLKSNVEIHAASIVECYLKDGRQVGRQVPERFDRVLLDAPCSSEARFYLGEAETFRYWSEKKVKEMQRKQKQLLHSALQALKPGGVLVYSTCSFAPEENELVIDRQLRKWGRALQLLKFEPPFENYQPGLTEWKGKRLDPCLDRAVRILPSATMEGFFVCAIEKAECD